MSPTSPSQTSLPQSPLPVQAPITESVNPKPRRFPVRVIFVPIFLGLSIVVGAWLGLFFKIKKEPMVSDNTVNLTPSPIVMKLKSEVVYLTGTAWKYSGEQKTVIQEGEVLETSDVVETGSRAKIVINFDDGSIIRMDELTTIDLSVMTPASISLQNQQGKIYARVQKDPQHKFAVQAGNIVVEATGTIFSVENSDLVKVSVFENSVKVNAGDKQLAEVGELQQWDNKEEKTRVMDLKKAKQDTFLAWNLERDNLTVTEPTIKPSPIPTAKEAGIKLFAKAETGGVVLEWELNGVDTPNGVKILKGQNVNPVYPGDDFVYLGDTGLRRYKWSVTDGKTWHFRVCRYVENKCSNYSNDVSVQASTGETESASGQITSINLSVQKQGGNAVINWSVDGNSPLGFKVAWSVSENPTYPPRDGDKWSYLSSPDARQHTVEGLSGTYHFRVCEYLGGSCGKYSNDVSDHF